MVKVELVYGGVNRQFMITLTVPENTTIETVIDLSGVLRQFPELFKDQLNVGIWGKKASLIDAVKEDDRVEIYRPLLIDPKTARLKRSKR